MLTVIGLIKKRESFECLGVIGRFSTADDGIDLDIPVDAPWWVPTEGGPSVWFEKMLPTLKEYL